MHLVGSIIYILCVVTSLVAMFLLLRSYRRNGSRLLLWSAAAFVAFALNNLFLFADIVLLPECRFAAVPGAHGPGRRGDPALRFHLGSRLRRAMLNIYDFIGGALMLGYLVLGLFFLKFWRRTRDPLFMMFAFAFWLLAANAIAVSGPTASISMSAGRMCCACSLSC